jgi:hypothetical protein
VTAERPDRLGVAAWIMAGADAVLFGAIILALALKFLLAFRINIHWDEFYFLSLVHDYLRGELAGRLQTFHVHFFSWLPIVGTGEINQIIAGRLTMVLCAIVSTLLVYGIARRFVSRGGALFGVFGYLSVTVIVMHGASFRADPIAIFLVLLSIYLTLCRPGGVVGAALAGAVMAIAMLVTIKTIFYFVAIGAAIWWLAPNFRNRVRLAVPFAVVLGLVFWAGYLWHASVLAAPEAGAATGFMGRTASKMFIEDGLFPRWRELLIVVLLNPLFWFMTVEGAVLAWSWTRGRTDHDRRDGWLVLALALPILTPVFYRNAFAYFYVFILPAASILVAISYDRHLQKWVDERAVKQIPFVLLLIAAQCIFFLANYGQRLPNRITPERTTLGAIHAVFPNPVPYIGGYGIAATMPRVNFFMSSWGIDNYRRAGRPIFAGLVAKTQPPLLVADSPSLYAAMLPDITVADEYTLLPADIRFLKENYLQYWGMLFVAGKRLQASSADNVAFDMAISGDYRLDSEAAVMIDGALRQPGDIISLAAGPHRFEAGSARGEVFLRWAKAPPPLESEPVSFFAFFDIRR